MAQKKITISLSIVETEHLRGALDLAQINHEDEMGRANPAITRVQAKLEEAVGASLAAQNTKEVPEDAGDGEPAGDDD